MFSVQLEATKNNDHTNEFYKGHLMSVEKMRIIGFQKTLKCFVHFKTKGFYLFLFGKENRESLAC